MTSYTMTTWKGQQTLTRDQLWTAMQEKGLRYSELMGHIQDLEAGHTVWAEDGTTFQLAGSGQLLGFSVDGFHVDETPRTSHPLDRKAQEWAALEDEPIRTSLAMCLSCGASWEEPLEWHPRNGCQQGPAPTRGPRSRKPL